MPYIKKEDRKYSANIENILSIVGSVDKTNSFTRLECLSYFLWSFMLEVSYDKPEDLTPESLSGVVLDYDILEKITHNVKEISRKINLHDLLGGGAGEINYVVSAVIWGFLGDCVGFKNASYGARTYIKGVMHEIYEFYKDHHQRMRAKTVFLGVITDIIDEMYRRKTSVYEDQKIQENGDVWPLKTFQVKEFAPIEISQDLEWSTESANTKLDRKKINDLMKENGWEEVDFGIWKQKPKNGFQVDSKELLNFLENKILPCVDENDYDMVQSVKELIKEKKEELERVEGKS